jgi:MFS family permease
MRHVFRTFRSRNYRLFSAGQFLSLAGTWMSMMAMGWLVYRLTGSPVMLGFVGFSMQFPTFLVSPLAGALVDRWNRRTVLLATQSVNMVAMLGLAAATLSGRVEVWQVFTVCILLGITKAFDLPARQSLVVEMIEHRDDLSNAIALNSSMFQAAKLLGPMLGGGVMWAAGLENAPQLGEAGGEGLCFLLDGLSYVAVISSLAALRLENRTEPPVRRHIAHDMVEGFRHAFGFPPIRSLLLLLGAIALLGMPYNTLLPMVADRVLDGNEGTYSLLMGAAGLGAFFGAMYLASRRSVLGLGRVITLAVVLFGGALSGFSFSVTLPVALGWLILCGASSMIAMAGVNTVIQTLVADETRGRVMSFIGMTFMGGMPLGALLFGESAARMGAMDTLRIGGVCCVLAGVVFGIRLPALRVLARPVYVERGLLPDFTRAEPE